jgi:hypothetical protein
MRRCGHERCAGQGGKPAAVTAGLLPTVLRSAEISDDGRYRYVLNRRWGHPSLPVMPWVALNPSLADGQVDDPSVRRMCGFARREGAGGICLLNAYAMRSPNPRRLAAAGDPVGPDNDRWLAGLAEDAGGMPVVVAWGAHPLALARVPRILELLAGIPLVCLGVTRSGAPRHPLYVRGDAKLIPWAPQ